MFLTKPPQESEHLPRKQRQRRYLVCFVVTIFLFAGAALWILNLEMIIAGPWSSILSVIFTVLGVFIAFLQWYIQPRKSSLQDAERIFSERLGNMDFGLTKRKGALLVRVKKNLSGATVYLHHGFNAENMPIDVAANIIERDLCGIPCFIAIFPSLEPGNYTASISKSGYKANITISTKMITEIDWRYIHINVK